MAITCDPNALNAAAAAAGFGNLSPRQNDQITAYLLRAIAGLEAVTPTELANAAACFCFNGTRQFDAVRDYLLCQIANGGTPGTCESLSGDASPAGAVTPDFIGQLYNQNSGEAFFYSTGLTDADWTEITTACDGGIAWVDGTLTADHFIITAQNHLESMGLDGLVTVTGSAQLYIHHNSLLNSLSFPNLASVDSALIEIYNNDLLESSTYPALTTLVSANLEIHDNASLLAQTFPVFTAITDSYFYLNDNVALVTVDLSAFQSVDGGEFTITGCDSLESVLLTALATIDNSAFFSISANSSLTTLDLSSVAAIRNSAFLEISVCDAIESLSFPALTSFGDGSGRFYIHQNAALLSVSLGNLTTIDSNDLEFYDNDLLASIDLSSLVSIINGAYLQFYTNPVLNFLSLDSFTTIDTNASLTVSDTLLPSIDLSSLVTVGSGGQFSLYNNASLTSIDISNVVFGSGNYIYLAGNALDETTVDLVLARGVASGMTDGSIDLSGGTNAAPSIAGQADKATLIGAGVTVTTN